MSLSEFILDVDERSFEKDVLLRSLEVPVVVDFWAPWCSPCRVLGPILERLAIEAGGAFVLAKVNVDENPNLAIRFGVQGIPAVKAFRNGELAGGFVGAQPESRVREFIQKIAPSESDAAVEAAKSLLQTRHWLEAERAFREVFAMDENNADAALGLTESLLMQGHGVEASSILDNFPHGLAWATAEKLRPLAELLSEVERADETLNDDPLTATLHQSARLIARGNLSAAMDGMLDILREDKKHREGLVKQVMLALFVVLGDDDPITREYRDELASVLF